MKTLIFAMPAFFRRSVAVMIQYRGEMLLWAFWGVVYPAVAMAMWSAAIAGKQGGGDIRGFSSGDFAAYFLLTMIVGHLCTAWDVYEMGYFVRTGAMSPKLLRPILPVWESLSDNLAYKVTTTAILAPIWIVIAWLTAPRVELGLMSVAAGLMATVLASALNFLWGYIVALSAFWFTRSEAVGQLWFGASLFFGGRLAPLTILPPLLQRFADLMPFKWIIYFPAAALMGKLQPRELAVGLGWQLAWLGAGIAVFRFIWRNAVKRYSAVGA